MSEAKERAGKGFFFEKEPLTRLAVKRLATLSRKERGKFRAPSKYYRRWKFLPCPARPRC
jgi:hypothetical protein